MQKFYWSFFFCILLFLFYAANEATAQSKGALKGPPQGGDSQSVDIVTGSDGSASVPVTVTLGSDKDGNYTLEGKIVNEYFDEDSKKFSAPITRDSTEKTKLRIVAKVGEGNANKFAVYKSNGPYAIYQVMFDTAKKGFAFQLVKRDTIKTPMPSGGVTKIAGDDIYALISGNIVVQRSGKTNWDWDTVGISVVNDIFVDSSQNIYAGTGSGLFVQALGSSVWKKVTAFPGKRVTIVYLDRRQRIFAIDGSNGYTSVDHGNTWSTLPAGPVANTNDFGDDAFGNIYITNGTTAYRSADVGQTWVQIDLGIRSQVVDTSMYQFNNAVIHQIKGDTILWAATIWGLFVSKDQGNTWSYRVGTGLVSVNGYWRDASGNEVATNDLGCFVCKAHDTTWTQTFPPPGHYLKMGSIFADDQNNLYTLLSLNGIFVHCKSVDKGLSWTPDSTGFWQITKAQSGTYYVDEKGNAHIFSIANGTYIVYKKDATGPWVLDTIGLNSELPNFGSVAGFASDHGGYLYMFGHNNAKNSASTWRRPIAGTTWQADTVGLGSINITSASYDQNGGIMALNWSNYVGLYHRNSAGWVHVPYPSNVYSFALASAVGGEPGGGLLASFYLYNGMQDSKTCYGVYCTHDEGKTWTAVTNFPRVFLKSFLNYSDTTWTIGESCLIPMTCNGLITVTDVPELRSSTEGFEVYANPANEVLHVRCENAVLGSSLRLYDEQGTTLFRQVLRSNESSIDIRALNAGVYFVTIEFDSKIFTRKIVVQH